MSNNVWGEVIDTSPDDEEEENEIRKLIKELDEITRIKPMPGDIIDFSAAKEQRSKKVKKIWDKIYAENQAKLVKSNQ